MLISDLPDGLRQLAEQRLKEYLRLWLHEPVPTDSTVNSFVWSRTEEGHNFWSKVNLGNFSGYTPPEPMYNNYTE